MPEKNEQNLIGKVEVEPAAPSKVILKAQTQKETTSSKEMQKTIANKDTIPAIQVTEAKPKFKKIHVKDTFWLENDIYQTIANMTKGKKLAKALIINKALKDYFKKNKIALQTYINEK